MRTIIYDITHLQHRLAYDAPSGIDRVDLMFAKHFGCTTDAPVMAGHYGRTYLKTAPRLTVTRLVGEAEARWREDVGLAGDPEFQRTAAWLKGEAGAETSRPVEAPKGLGWTLSTKLLPFYRYAHLRRQAHDAIPEGAIYLNVAQHSLEHPRLFRWMAKRPDVKPVFFLHDLLPLDFPEFWWFGHDALFRRRMDIVFGHAAALMTSSEAVRDRILFEYRQRGRPAVPVLACPLPSPLESLEAPAHDPALAATPFFVTIGTIEPRKNHMLLLNIWRALARQGGPVPKLVLIGKRGWQNDQTVGMLDLCPALRDHVIEVAGLSAEAVRTLLVHARALLMPSFAEGYGLPVVEALSLKVPVVASDIAVFREVSKGKALLLDPIDGCGWKAAIHGLVDRGSETATKTAALASTFRPLPTADFFERVDAFLRRVA